MLLRDTSNFAFNVENSRTLRTSIHCAPGIGCALDSNTSQSGHAQRPGKQGPHHRTVYLKQYIVSARCGETKPSKIRNPKARTQMRNQNSKIRNQNSKIRNPESEIQNPKYEIQTSKCQTQTPKSATQNPKSKIQNSKQEIKKFKMRNPN